MVFMVRQNTSAKGFFANQGRVKELCGQLEKYRKGIERSGNLKIIVYGSFQKINICCLRG